MDVLGWKQTITGVGHCRQVGCPESGIDEAVKRLTAAGYKVSIHPMSLFWGQRLPPWHGCVIVYRAEDEAPDYRAAVA